MTLIKLFLISAVCLCLILAFSNHTQAQDFPDSLTIILGTGLVIPTYDSVWWGGSAGIPAADYQTYPQPIPGSCHPEDWVPGEGLEVEWWTPTYELTYLQIQSVHNIVLMGVDDNNPDEAAMPGDEILLQIDGNDVFVWYRIAYSGFCGGENPSGVMFALHRIEPVPTLGDYGIIGLLLIISIFMWYRYRRVYSTQTSRAKN